MLSSSFVESVAAVAVFLLSWTVFFNAIIELDDSSSLETNKPNAVKLGLTSIIFLHSQFEAFGKPVLPIGNLALSAICLKSVYRSELEPIHSGLSSIKVKIICAVTEASIAAWFCRLTFSLKAAKNSSAVLPNAIAAAAAYFA